MPGNRDRHILSKRHGSTVYRLKRGGRSVVMKCFSAEADKVEIEAYKLLMEQGIPLLPVHSVTPTAIILEDLADSDDWRLAAEADVEKQDVGAAVARWYRLLHEAGFRLTASRNPPAFLKRECDDLTSESVHATGHKLSLAGNAVWKLSADHIEDMKQAFREFPETLNYNDFHWTNLALSRSEPLKAVVFDYHLLGIGPAYCDVRNILGSLGEAAGGAFLAEYGHVDEGPKVLDAPLSVLYSLTVAAGMDLRPKWVEGCIRCASSGELERLILAAISAI